MRGLTGLGTPLGAKSHCVNNPINLTDPDGLQPVRPQVVPRYPSRTYRVRNCPSRGTPGRGSSVAIPEPDVWETTAEFESAKADGRLPVYTLPSGNPTEQQYSTYQQALVQAYKMYPNKAGKIEYHHPLPKYMGGDPNQKLIPLDAAYHQMITNEFRNKWSYGQQYPTYEKALEYARQIYSKYPLVSPTDVPGPRIGPR